MQEKRRQNGCPGHIMRAARGRSPDSSWPGGMRTSPGGYHFKRFPSEENREESEQKGANKVECKKWSAKGTYRKASAERHSTQDLNTLVGQRPRADSKRKRAFRQALGLFCRRAALCCRFLEKSSGGPRTWKTSRGLALPGPGGRKVGPQ